MRRWTRGTRRLGRLSSSMLLRHSLRSQQHKDGARLAITLQALTLLVRARVRLGGTCRLVVDAIMDYYGFCGLLAWTFMYCMDYYSGLYGLLLWTVWTTMDFMDYNYGLCALLICSCVWFEMNVVYISISKHVVLRLYIHVIFVYGLHQKIGETLPKFSS